MDKVEVSTAVENDQAMVALFDKRGTLIPINSEELGKEDSEMDNDEDETP